jgi:hypothetical protein
MPRLLTRNNNNNNNNSSTQQHGQQHYQRLVETRLDTLDTEAILE